MSVLSGVDLAVNKGHVGGTINQKSVLFTYKPSPLELHRMYEKKMLRYGGGALKQHYLCHANKKGTVQQI